MSKYMMMLTKENKATAGLYPIGSQSEKGDGATAWLKFFDPCGRYTFYVTEAQEDEYEHGWDWTFFGWCVSALGEDCDEWGLNTLGEIQKVRGSFGLGIERDRGFHPQTIKEIRA